MKKIFLCLALALLTLTSFGCGSSDAVKAQSQSPSLSDKDGNSSAAKADKSEKKDASSSTEQSKPKGHSLSDFEIILQEPELPTGCEITSLTMALNYYKLNADKVEMALNYLPTVYGGFYYDYYGNFIGPDLYNYFFGDPTTDQGTVCGAGAITTAANAFLKDKKSKLKAEDMTGASPNELYKLIDSDIPVVVWITIFMNGRGDLQGWSTENGTYVDWGNEDHCGVLIGYTEDTVIIADPIQGRLEYDKEMFEATFEERSRQCVAIK